MRDRITRRRGSEALEFAVSLPILLIVAAGIVDFGWFATHQSAVFSAASTGARAGSKTPIENDPRLTARLFAERTLQDAAIDGATVVAEFTNLANGDRAMKVSVDAPYGGIWGFVPLPVDYEGEAVFRMDEQPEN